MKCTIYINSANSKCVVVLVWGVIIKTLARRETVYQRHVLDEKALQQRVTGKAYAISKGKDDHGGSPGM